MCLKLQFSLLKKHFQWVTEMKTKNKKKWKLVKKNNNNEGNFKTNQNITFLVKNIKYGKNVK